MSAFRIDSPLAEPHVRAARPLSDRSRKDKQPP
jgi:hypothetical protein